MLEDKRRLNVALTRGKHKLLLLGHADTLSPKPNCCFSDLLDLVHVRSGQEDTRTLYADLRIADIVDVLQWSGPI